MKNIYVVLFHVELNGVKTYIEEIKGAILKNKTIETGDCSNSIRFTLLSLFKLFNQKEKILVYNLENYSKLVNDRKIRLSNYYITFVENK